jgi:hypothetical protein
MLSPGHKVDRLTAVSSAALNHQTIMVEVPSGLSSYSNYSRHFMGCAHRLLFPRIESNIWLSIELFRAIHIYEASFLSFRTQLSPLIHALSHIGE